MLVGMARTQSITNISLADSSENSREVGDILVALVKVLARDAAREFLKQQNNQAHADKSKVQRGELNGQR